MRTVSRTVRVAAALMVVAAAPALAQQHGNVVYVSPKHGTGVSIIGDYARGLNDASFKTNYFGGRAVLGLPMITVSAGVGMVMTDDALDPGGESEITFGGTASLNVLSAPLLPVAIAVFAGVGYFSESGATSLSVPIGAALALSVPTPGLSIEPWIAPRFQVARLSGGGVSATDTNFGVSGGINLGLPMGLGFHAAFDYVNETGASPLVVGAGIHYKISVPGLGMM